MEEKEIKNETNEVETKSEEKVNTEKKEEKTENKQDNKTNSEETQKNSSENNNNGFSKKDIENGKVMGILSYIGILSLIPYFAEKENEFVKYHAKQGVNLFLIEVICSAGLSIMGMVLWLLLGLVALASFCVGIGSFALSIIGIVNVCNGETKELPIINKYKLIK